MAFHSTPKALFFDVFGTCVNWRSAVTRDLEAASHVALSSATASLASTVRLRASDMSSERWGQFAQEWRNRYKAFTRAVSEDATMTWKTIDQHHRESLQALLEEWGLAGLWTDEEVKALSLVWHRLDPWPDSAPGIALLNQRCLTATLSNGNMSLLTDLQTHGHLGFQHILSAELFGSYKPSPKVYLGAVEQFGLEPGECAMVAAHLNDLRAAKNAGLKTVYVERPGEEDWSVEQVAMARQEGWVDLWVTQGVESRGFITLAEGLGVDVAADLAT